MSTVKLSDLEEGRYALGAEENSAQLKEMDSGRKRGGNYKGKRKRGQVLGLIWKKGCRESTKERFGFRKINFIV